MLRCVWQYQSPSARTVRSIATVAALGMWAVACGDGTRLPVSPSESAVASLAKASASSVKHHHYQLIDLGTFGGPSSYFNTLLLSDGLGFGTAFYGIAQVRNTAGTLVGQADLSSPDPFPSFCYAMDCFVNHAFAWRNGVKTDLGTLPRGASSAAFWINERGWITGNSENGQTDPLLPGLPEVRAVLWRYGSIEDLGTLGGSSSFAVAMNNGGDVTGVALDGTPDPFSFYYQFLYGFSGGTRTRAFVWDTQRGMQDLGTLGGPDALSAIINQRGQIAGVADVTATPDPSIGLPPFHPFLWERGKGMKDLGSFGGVETASVNGLNERGEVVGGLDLPGDELFHPFLWNGTTLIDLTAPPFDNSGSGEANWINADGEVVGIADLRMACPDSTADIERAFLSRSGVMTDLGSVRGTTYSRADFINSRSQVVGGTWTCNDSTFDGFLWESGSMVDLNTVLAAPTDLHIYWAPFINENGEIGAFALTPDLLQSHVVLLIPCDEGHPGVAGCDYRDVTGAEAAARAPNGARAVPLSTRAEVFTRLATALAHRHRVFHARLGR